jgi:hypothetical protein
MAPAKDKPTVETLQQAVKVSDLLRFGVCEPLKEKLGKIELSSPYILPTCSPNFSCLPTKLCTPVLHCVPNKRCFPEYSCASENIVSRILVFLGRGGAAYRRIFAIPVFASLITISLPKGYGM